MSSIISNPTFLPVQPRTEILDNKTYQIDVMDTIINDAGNIMVIPLSYSTFTVNNGSFVEEYIYKVKIYTGTDFTTSYTYSLPNGFELPRFQLVGTLGYRKDGIYIRSNGNIIIIMKNGSNVYSYVEIRFLQLANLVSISPTPLYGNNSNELRTFIRTYITDNYIIGYNLITSNLTVYTYTNNSYRFSTEFQANHSFIDSIHISNDGMIISIISNIFAVSNIYRYKRQADGTYTNSGLISGNIDVNNQQNTDAPAFAILEDGSKLARVFNNNVYIQRITDSNVQQTGYIMTQPLCNYQAPVVSSIKITNNGNKVSISFFDLDDQCVYLGVYLKKDNNWIYQKKKILQANLNNFAVIPEVSIISRNGIYGVLHYLTADNNARIGEFYDITGIEPDIISVNNTLNQGTYFPGTLTSFLDVNSQYVEYETSSIYTYSVDSAPGTKPPEFYVQFWVNRSLIKGAIDLSYNNTTYVSANAAVAALYNAVKTNQSSDVTFKFNNLSQSNINNTNTIFSEMKWNNSTVSNNVSLPDLFMPQNTLQITSNNEETVNVTIEVDGITKYESGVKLPYELSATQIRSYYINPAPGKINVINNTGVAPDPLTSISELSLIIPQPAILNQSDVLDCSASLNGIDIADGTLTTIMIDLMRTHCNNGFSDISTMTTARDLIDSMTGIVGLTADVPLTFYVAVRLFNNNIQSGTNDITNAVGSATNNDPFNLSDAYNSSSLIYTADTQLATNSNVDENTQFPGPGVIASRKLYTWILFKTDTEMLEISNQSNG